MAREWDGIPALRMDKFLYLCRCYVSAGFEWARRAEWEEGKIETIIDIIQDISLSTELERPQLTNGLRLHVLDIWVDALEGVQGEGSQMPLGLLLAPVRRLSEQTKDKFIRNRAKETLADERLKDWQAQDGTRTERDTTPTPHTKSHAAGLDGTYEDDDDGGDGDEWGGFDEG